MTLNGIDVSAVGQGADFNWEAWRGQIDFAGIKISEGLTEADPDAARNVAGARSIHVPVIGYHLLHAAQAGSTQAGYFMAHAEAAKLEDGDILAIDVEQAGLDGLTAQHLWQVADDFAWTIKNHFNAWPACYTDISLAQVAPPAIAECPLWLANPDHIRVIALGSWKLISFEQLGQRGVDRDVFYGDAAQLRALAVP